ncbi:hypothetical protein C4587_00720 [Candidatus Parcubacteria bacterium]|nr:MAG: hypothetical protein C4587_00720 [Candidatus Parcubacteria bacterium]
MLAVQQQQTQGRDTQFYGGVDLAKRRREYDDYLTAKAEEIKEQRLARHYFHGDQWTETELKVLKDRRQAPVTNNLFSLKINGIVGVLERLKQDPKAYPRTPKHEQGSEIATAALRYALDAEQWEMISPASARDCGVTGVGGLEIEITQGDMGDSEVGLNPVDSDLFFYDPRSFRDDFSDARFMGVAKWVGVDLAKEMFPEKADDLDGVFDGSTGAGAAHDQDRERKWVDTTNKRIRLIDHWYIERGEWKWCVYSGYTELMSGDSFLIDEKGKTQSKYIMFSANVDHDGDRYGFFRNIKSLQDETNQRRARSLAMLNGRRIRMTEGAVNDVEKLRREASRHDGVIVHSPGAELEFEDAKSLGDMRSHLEFSIKAEQDIEKFGPNPALIGEDTKADSGRAINLLQQAGMAQIGPFMISYKAWKLRVYRAVWNAIQHYWTAERWIRVTDDDGVAQFIQINGIDVDEFGRPAMVNALGSLDVDIILDEGPDTINMQADAFDALSALARAGERMPPGLLIELAPIQSSIKKKYLDMMRPAPEQQQMQQAAAQLQFAGAQADVADKQAAAELKKAQTVKVLADAGAVGQPQGEAGPSQMEMFAQVSETAARTHDLHATAYLKEAQTAKTYQDIQLAPQRQQQEFALKSQQMAQRNLGQRA